MASNKNNMKRSRVSPLDDFPDFGAIFMANRATIKECLGRSLFGLPSLQKSFVGGVKEGMVLFLFEYEERLLYGVFRASSNGGFAVVPGAFGSRFPAQVRVSKIWECDPLCEDEFGDAIAENYYARCKFRFGLSQHQVNNLLLLFETKRRKGSTVGSLSCEREYLNAIKSRKTDSQRLKFWRRQSLVPGKPIFECEQPNSCSSDQAAKDETRGSIFSSGSGNSISSFESKSDPNDGFSATISKEEPGTHNDSSKDTVGDLEDFIPLASPENSDTELESLQNNQTGSLALEQYFPMKLVVCECSQEGKQSASNANNSLKLNVQIKGLYSDGQKTSSVFSRLKFGPKDIGQENCGSSGVDRLVQESRGDSLLRHGKKETNVFSRLSLTSKAMQGINDTLNLKSGIGRHKFSQEDCYGYSEMRSLSYEFKQPEKEEDSAQDIMSTLFQYHSEWRKLDSAHKAFEQDYWNPAAKKNVFSRLSWSSESSHQENIVVTTTLQKRNNMVIKRGRNDKYNGFVYRRPETLPCKLMRGSEVPNGTKEAEENFDPNPHTSKMLKGETQIEEGEVVDDSVVSKYESDQQPQRKLRQTLSNKSSEAKTHSQEDCLNVQAPLGESTADKENSGISPISPISAEGNVAEMKLALLQKELQDVLDPLRCCGADKGEAGHNFQYNESNSGELLVSKSDPSDRVVKPPLKTYKRRAKVVKCV